MQEERMFTVKQVAEMLAVSEQTVKNYIKRNELLAFRVGLRGYRISPSDLAAFIEKRKHPKADE